MLKIIKLEGCYFIIRGSERSYCKITIDLEDYSHYVIGNIYENPDFKCPKCDGKLSVGQADLD